MVRGQRALFLGGQSVKSEDCLAGCIDGTTQTPAHCAYLEPRYLPDVCDALAEEESLGVGQDTTLETGDDAGCNGGVVTQTGGPEICVLRYGTFSLSAGATLTVRGPRALAIVTDGDLRVDGYVDASANGITNGPGGGTIVSGEPRGDVNGGGGAGFRQSGGNGGSLAADGGGGKGGATVDPRVIVPLVGGPAAAGGGGGGGAVTLISCRGTVSVAGTVNVGGGGGPGSPCQIDDLVTSCGAPGGGAAGLVVFQGLNVEIRGNLYANGGGGGGGGRSAFQPYTGSPGQDGTLSSTTCAAGGAPGSDGGGRGGAGACGPNPPGVGRQTDSQHTAGGGGGAAGYFLVYVPHGVTPTVDAVEVSPTVTEPGLVTVR